MDVGLNGLTRRPTFNKGFFSAGGFFRGCKLANVVSDSVKGNPGLPPAFGCAYP